MAAISLILLGITALFFIILSMKGIFKKLFKKEFCGLCAAVSITWIFLLILYWLKLFDDKIILALLIGESTAGIFYLVEAKVRKELTLFRLPFLLTLITIGYSLIKIPVGFGKNIVILLILWAVFIFAYLSRHGRLLSFVKKIIDCCRRW